MLKIKQFSSIFSHHYFTEYCFLTYKNASKVVGREAEGFNALFVLQKSVVRLEGYRQSSFKRGGRYFHLSALPSADHISTPLKG